VKPADHEYGFDPNKRVDHKVQRQVDPFIVFGIDAAGQALEDAGLVDAPEEMRLRMGCSIGSGIGGLPESKANRWCWPTRGRAVFRRISCMAA
jgi:3-oxoacyl-[acyl-carrier-protein] synthase II